jgi:hypothetical protein
MWKLCGNYAEIMRKLCGNYAEIMRKLYGNYAEIMRKYVEIETTYDPKTESLIDPN